MRRLPSKITYANVVATLALFIALGGVSWAAVKLPKNSVGTKQIKKNAVTSAKIKKNAITSAKIKNGSVVAAKVKGDSLTGGQIDESSLGVVPSSSVAATASDTQRAVRRVNISAAAADEGSARAAASEVPLGSYGQISVYGKCYHDTTSDRVYGIIVAKTTNDGSWAVLYDSTLTGDSSLSTTTPELNRIAAFQFASTTTTNNDYVFSAWALGTDGKGLAFDAHVASKNGNIPDQTALYSGERSCIFLFEGTELDS